MGTAPRASYTAADFEHSPFVLFYEITRACDLVCKHCRACAQPKRNPHELTNAEARLLFDQIASFPKPPLVVLTGGDPMKREDAVDLVRYSASRGLTTAMTPSATPLVTPEALARLKEAGLNRLAISLDGNHAATHDEFRGVPGSFDRTLEILDDAHAAGLSIQVNTTITRRNVEQMDAMAEMLAGYPIALWSVFFLVPVGRGLAEQRISPQEYENVFEHLWRHAERQPYAIKTTEAPHYRRFVLQHQGDPLRLLVSERRPGSAPPIHRAPLGVSDGKGVIFVSHTGSVFPSGFMPIKCGQAPLDSIVTIYQRSELLKSLRDPNRLKGKCGACDYRTVCGGSRARAYAVTRNPLGAEPDCSYQPPAWITRQSTVKEQSCLASVI